MKEHLGAEAAVVDFENEFLERGPCKQVFDLLEQDFMTNYSKSFLSLVSNLEFYTKFDEVNQKAADVVAACTYLQSTDGLMERAYDVYTIISMDSIETNLQKLGDLLFALDAQDAPVSRSSDEGNSGVTDGAPGEYDTEGEESDTW